jgi:hypothetical protein
VMDTPKLEVMMGTSFLNGVLLNWRRTGQDIALVLESG